MAFGKLNKINTSDIGTDGFTKVPDGSYAVETLKLRLSKEGTVDLKPAAAFLKFMQFHMIVISQNGKNTIEIPASASLTDVPSLMYAFNVIPDDMPHMPEDISDSDAVNEYLVNAFRLIAESTVIAQPVVSVKNGWAVTRDIYKKRVLPENFYVITFNGFETRKDGSFNVNFNETWNTRSIRARFEIIGLVDGTPTPFKGVIFSRYVNLAYYEKNGMAFLNVNSSGDSVTPTSAFLKDLIVSTIDLDKVESSDNLSSDEFNFLHSNYDGFLQDWSDYALSHNCKMQVHVYVDNGWPKFDKITPMKEKCSPMWKQHLDYWKLQYEIENGLSNDKPVMVDTKPGVTTNDPSLVKQDDLESVKDSALHSLVSPFDEEPF